MINRPPGVESLESQDRETDGLLSYWPSNNSRRFFASRFPIPLRDTNVAKCFPLGLVLPLSQLRIVELLTPTRLA